MSETPVSVSMPLTSTQLASPGTYILLPFSSTVADANLDDMHVLGPMEAPISNDEPNGDDVILQTSEPFNVETTNEVVATTVPLINIHDLVLALGAEAGSSTVALPDNILTSMTEVRDTHVPVEDCHEPANFMETHAAIGGQPSSYLKNPDEKSKNTQMHICQNCGFQASDAMAYNEHLVLWGCTRHYRCGVCETVFDKVDKLNIHEKRCRAAKEYRCDCGEMFNRERNYTLHLATHNLSDEQLRCPLCEETFRRAAAFLCHLKLHAFDDVVSCTVCQEEFSSNEELRYHTKTTHGGNKATVSMHICKQCGATFKRPLELAEHMITHKKIKETLRTNYRRKPTISKRNSAGRYSCSICSKSFDKKNTLDRHQLIHTGERPFVCNVCGKSFNQKGALMFHEARHLPQKPHKCLLCGAGFTQRGNLRTHVKRVHTAAMVNNQRAFECSLCSCTFKSPLSLRAHLSKRHNEHAADSKEHGKSDDAKSASYPNEPVEPTVLERNQNVGFESASNCDPVVAVQADSFHSQTAAVLSKSDSSRPWNCAICSKYFIKLSDLKRHIRIHTGERPFSCEVCPRRFALRSTLDKHVRSVHLRIKASRCHICWKELSNASSLAGHLKRHNRQSFACDNCSIFFYSKSALAKHKCQSLQVNTEEGMVNGALVSDRDSANALLQEPMMETEYGVVQLVKKRSHQDTRTMPLVDERGHLVRPYCCSYCPLRFKKGAHLEEHVRGHTNLRPYICLVGNCGGRFTSVSALREHALIHAGVRRHICNVCKKAFRTRRSLNRHAFVHSDPAVRPFLCPYCGKRFKRGVLCRKHIKIHKGDQANRQNQRSDQANGNAAPIGFVASTNWVAPMESGNDYNSGPGYSGEHAAAECTNWNNPQDTAPTFAGCLSNAMVDNCVSAEAPLAEQPVDYLPTGSGFFSSDQPTLDSLPICWDSNGQNVSASIDVQTVGDLVTSSECLVQTGLDVGQNGPTMGTADAIAPAYDLCPETFGKSQESRFEEPKEILQWVDPCELVPQVIQEAPYWKRQTNNTIYSCPQCNQRFYKAIYLTRHVYHAHPNTTKSAPATGENPNSALPPSDESVFPVEHRSGIRNNTVAAQNNHVAVGAGLDHGHIQSRTAQKEQLAADQYELNMTGYLPVVSINHNKQAWMAHGEADPSAINVVTQSGIGGDLSDSLNGKTRTCPCCGKTFKKPSDLVRHIRIHTDERPYQCECGKAFRVKSALVAHRQTHESNRMPMVSCQVCKKMLASNGALKVHLRQHTNEKQYRCSQCGQGFGFSAQLRSHILRDHSTTTDHSIQQPGPLTSADSSAFTQVVPAGDNESILENDRLILSMLYNANNELQLTVRRFSSNDDQIGNGVILEVSYLRQLMDQGLTISLTFNCDGVPETNVTVDPSVLLEHGLRDCAQSGVSGHKNRTLEPTTPSAYLTSCSTARDHDAGEFAVDRNPVGSEASFIVECKICDLRFSNVHESRMHFQSPDHETAMNVQRETNGPTHMCEICGKMFVTKMRLKRHIRSHTGEKPFQCTICGECFTQNSSLRKHCLSKHTAYKPYVCPFCDRRFTLKYNMATHIRRAHGQNGASGNVVAVEPASSGHGVRTYLLSL